MSRARQAVRDIDLLEKHGLTDANTYTTTVQSMRGFRSYCKNDPTREFQGGNASNCDRLRYAVEHLDDGLLEEVLKAGRRRFPK